jgi:hypothetical protein
MVHIYLKQKHYDTVLTIPLLFFLLFSFFFLLLPSKLEHKKCSKQLIMLKIYEFQNI